MSSKRGRKKPEILSVAEIQPLDEEIRTQHQNKLTKQVLTTLLSVLISSSLVSLTYAMLIGGSIKMWGPHVVFLTFYSVLLLLSFFPKKFKPRVVTDVAVFVYMFGIFPTICRSLTLVHPMIVGLAAFVLVISILLFDGRKKRIMIFLFSMIILCFTVVNYLQAVAETGFDLRTAGKYIGAVVTLAMTGVATNAFKNKLYEMNINLQRYAITDSLTGIYNSRAMSEMLKKYTKSFLEMGQVFSIAALDMDNFKQINDLYGHGAGDDYLVLTARVMKESLRDGDLLARTGGDEFAAILPNCTATQGKRIIQRLLNAVGEIETKPMMKKISFSAGICDSAEAKHLGMDILKIADHKLYHSKAMGRNMVYCGSLTKQEFETGITD